MNVDVEASPQQGLEESAEGLPRPRRIFNLRFSRTGLAVAGFFFAVSLLPSLLPRAPYVQGVVVGGHADDRLRAGRRGPGAVGLPGDPEAAGPGAHDRAGDPRGADRVDDRPGRVEAGRVAEQHPRAVRDGADLADDMAGDPADHGRGGRTDPDRLPVVAGAVREGGRLVGPAPAAAPGLGAGRDGAAAAVLGAAHRCAGQRVVRCGQPVWFSVRDTTTRRGAHPPAESEAAVRAGSWSSGTPWPPGSPVRRDRGAHGSRSWTAANGGGAEEPIRVYARHRVRRRVCRDVRIWCSPSCDAPGAFDREVLVIATTTGTGFPDPRGWTPWGTCSTATPRSPLSGTRTCPAGVAAGRQAGRPGHLPGGVRHRARVLVDCPTSPGRVLPVRVVLGLLRCGSVLNSISIVNEPSTAR